MKYKVCIGSMLDEEKLYGLAGIINKCQSVPWNRRCRWKGTS